MLAFCRFEGNSGQKTSKQVAPREIHFALGSISLQQAHLHVTSLWHGEFKRRILKTKKQGQMPPKLFKNQPRTRGCMEARTATSAYNGSNSDGSSTRGQRSQRWTAQAWPHFALLQQMEELNPRLASGQSTALTRGTGGCQASVSLCTDTAINNQPRPEPSYS